MFKPDERISELVEAVHKLTEPLHRGDCLEHEAIRAVRQVEPHEAPWDTVVAKVRRLLRERRGIATWPEPAIGYRLLTKQETLLMVPQERDRRAFRQIKRAIRDVRALPSQELSAHQRRLQATQLEALQTSRRELLSQLRRQAVLSRKWEGHPRPKANAQAVAMPQHAAS